MNIPSFFSRRAPAAPPVAPPPAWLTSQPLVTERWSRTARMRLREITSTSPEQIDQLLWERRAVFLNREPRSSRARWIVADGDGQLVIVRDEADGAVITVYASGETPEQRDPLVIAMANRIADPFSPADDDYLQVVGERRRVSVRIRHQLPRYPFARWLRYSVSANENCRPLWELVEASAGDSGRAVPKKADVHQVLVVIDNGGPILFSATYPLGVNDFPR